MGNRRLALGLAGLGLVAGAFMGCQTSTSDKTASTSVSDATEALLRLAVKDSGACLDLKARCVRAHEAGNDSDSLITNLVDSCIVDTGAAHRIRHEGWPGHGDRGFGWPRLDSAARAALCDSLTAELAKTDSTDSGYAKLKHMAGKVCSEPGFHGRAPGMDSAARAALCDSMKAVLAGIDTASVTYGPLKHATAEVCEDRRPPMSREHGFGFDRDRERGRGGHGRR